MIIINNYEGVMMKRLENVHPEEIPNEEFLIPLNIIACRFSKETVTPQTELEQRRDTLRRRLVDMGADACIITTPVNLFYLTGCIFDGFLYIPHEADPVQFIKRPAGITGDRTAAIRKPEQLPELLPRYGLSTPRILLAETEQLPYSDILRLVKALGNPELKSATALLRAIRSIKSEWELEQMRQCARIQAEVYQEIPSLYRQGMRDIDFQIEVEYLMRRKGSLGIFRAYGNNMDIFMGNVLTGENAQTASPFDFSMGGGGLSPYLPIGASGIPIREGMTVMFDMAGNYTPLQSDMSRTFSVGKVAQIAYDAHQVSIDICSRIEAVAKAGTSCAVLYEDALATAERHGLRAYFMGTVQQAKFIGHGIGLEINEPPVLTPRSKELLQPGMTIAVEPKFVLPGIGAVGIENSYIVHSENLEKITLCQEKMLPLHS